MMRVTHRGTSWDKEGGFMAGNGGGVGTTQQADPIGQRHYGSAVYNNPALAGQTAQQGAPSMARPTVNPHTGQAIDPANVNFGGRSPNNPGQQPAQMSFNFAPGQAAALGNDIRAIQQNPSLGLQFPSNPAQGMVGGMQGQQGQMAPMANYLPQLQQALTGWGGQQQAPAAMPWFMQQQGMAPQYGGGQMPMINSMPWQNPFLMSALYNQGTMWR